MPVAAPLIMAAGTAYAAHKASQASKQAAKSQEGSASEALAFQREQEAARKANFDRAYDMWNQSRNMLAQRYGINLGSVPPPGATGMPPGLGAPAGPPPQTAGVARPGGFAPVAAAPTYRGRQAGGGPGFIPELQGVTLGDLMMTNRRA